MILLLGYETVDSIVFVFFIACEAKKTEKRKKKEKKNYFFPFLIILSFFIQNPYNSALNWYTTSLVF